MKVELVKVKINKLKEVKKQLRRRKYLTKKNLKNLLLGNEEREPEDDLFYQSINAIFQDGTNNIESMHSTGYSDTLESNYHVDLEDLLESLGTYQNDLLKENTSESCSIKEPEDEKVDGSINLAILDHHSIDNFNCSENNKNIGEQQGGEINLCKDIQKETTLFCNKNKEKLDSTINLPSNELGLDMVELSNYYIPNSLFETSNDQIFEVDDFFNEVTISTAEDPNKENIDELDMHFEEQKVENIEIDDLSELPNLNNNKVEGDTNNHGRHKLISNSLKGVAMINPILVNIPAADFQTMALYQLQEKNDSEELSNLGDTEILKNYSWEQKANLIASAKMLYTKRTRTLIHWLDPDISLPKLRATLELSWQNLPQWQKEVYISQVMGPLVVEQSIPMLNPQLESGELAPASPRKTKKERKKFSDFIENV